eukprot:jgi/Mesvir1/5502/Mv25563-RA.1
MDGRSWRPTAARHSQGHRLCCSAGPPLDCPMPSPGSSLHKLSTSVIVASLAANCGKEASARFSRNSAIAITVGPGTICRPTHACPACASPTCASTAVDVLARSSHYRWLRCHVPPPVASCILAVPRASPQPLFPSLPLSFLLPFMPCSRYRCGCIGVQSASQNWTICTSKESQPSSNITNNVAGGSVQRPAT